jgi:hypothetical protein
VLRSGKRGGGAIAAAEDIIVQETGYWGAGWKMWGKRLNRGKQPRSLPAGHSLTHVLHTVSPMSFART